MVLLPQTLLDVYKNKTVNIYRNIDSRSCNSCCSGKDLNITYSKYIYLALGIQHAMCMCHNVIRDLSDPRIFFHVSHKRQDLFKKMY